MLRSWLIAAALASAGCIVQVGPSCVDGIRNGSETDVDCGGLCGACGIGMRCATPNDCVNGQCVGGVCAMPPSCSDGIKNEHETGVDCGGTDPNCAPCATGGGCLIANDCQSLVCGANLTCSAPTCGDGVQNGGEAGVDCGGPCPPCGHFGGSSYSGMPGPTDHVFNNIVGDTNADVSGQTYGYAVSGHINQTTFPASTSYRVMWFGDANHNVFYGSVWTAGIIMSITPGCAGMTCAWTTADYYKGGYDVTVAGAGQRMDFDSFAPAGAAMFTGFDIEVVQGNAAGNPPNDQPVYVDLLIDGEPDAQHHIWFNNFDTGPPTVTTNPYNGAALPAGYQPQWGLYVK
jgi:hypothetical protein